MFCTSCGKQIPDGSKFCRYCGATLGAAPSAAPAAKPAAPVPPVRPAAPVPPVRPAAPVPQARPAAPAPAAKPAVKPAAKPAAPKKSSGGAGKVIKILVIVLFSLLEIAAAYSTVMSYLGKEALVEYKTVYQLAALIALVIIELFVLRIVSLCTKKPAGAAPAKEKKGKEKKAKEPKAKAPAKKPVQPPVQIPVQIPVQKPAPQPAPQPVPQYAPQPTPQPVPQPAPQPVPQYAPQPTPQPVPQPAPQPVPQPTPQPVPQPAPQPVEEPAFDEGATVLLVPEQPKEKMCRVMLSVKGAPATVSEVKFPCRVGRDAASSDLVVGDPKVSRSHLVIREEDGEVVIEDVGSANGTRIGGEKITAAVKIAPTDVVSIGESTFSAEIV